LISVYNRINTAILQIRFTRNDEYKTALIELALELRVIRNKPAFIKRAVPQEALISIIVNDGVAQLTI